MITYLSRLTAERDSLTSAATDLADKAASDDRDLTDTEQASLKAWSERCAEIDGQLVEYNSQAESQRAYARLRDQLSTPEEPPRPMREPAVETRGWGDLFVASDAFQTYQGMGTSGRVTVPHSFETRAEITTATMPAGYLPSYIFTPASYTTTTPFLDVIGHVSTNSNTVEYLTWAPNPADAAEVVAEGAAKPEATMTPTGHSASLATYAHWKGITRQALEDIPQIRSIVEARLRGGIYVALEAAAVAALVAATLPTATDADMLTAIRKAMATVQSAGYAQAQTAVLNPADLAAIDVSVMGSTNNGPVVNSSAWGLRFVTSSAVAVGTAYVGDFSTGVTLFDRGAASVFMTDSHADYFVKNIILILAEIRALVAVTETSAVVEVTES